MGNIGGSLDNDEIESIWNRLVKSNFIDPNNLVGVNKDDLSRQIDRELRRTERKNTRGDPERLINAGFSDAALEAGSIKKDLIQKNYIFLEYKYRGKPAYKIMQKTGNPLDHKHAAPYNAAWTTAQKAQKEGKTPREILIEKLKEKGVDYSPPQTPTTHVKEAPKTRYPKRKGFLST